jgi:hypothetical protein
MIQVPDFIEEVIQANVNVTIMRHALYGIAFDMNLMAKSHMHLVQEDGRWYALMRYDEKHEVEDVEDLKRLARHGMHGREFINMDWAEFIMSDEDRAKRKLARSALDKLSPDERNAVAEYLK